MNTINKYPTMIRLTRLFLVLLMTSNICFGQEVGSLKVFENNNREIQNSWMLRRLTTEFDHRRAEVQIASKSEEKLLERRDSMRKWFNEKVGALPTKTSLNPKFGQKINMGSYIIESVCFESEPNHHVSGLLYTPTSGRSPYPAIYIPCGHSFDGKNSGSYRSAARLFALNGFVVLQGDPICQGERQQPLDKSGNPLFETGGTLQHEVLGQSLMLTGSNSLIRELIDNVRCIDFLEQQPFVNKDKIGVAGNSGGGTQTTYLAAYDRRIKVAVPSCYIATTEKKLNTIGSQDGCQQLWGEGKAGIEEQDFLFMAAPIPILISSAQKDFFNIEGAISAYNELKGLYSVLGQSEKVNQIIADANHGWSPSLRDGAVRWCKKWLMNDTTFIAETDTTGKFNPILATVTGEVLTSFPEEKSVTDLSIERMRNARIARNEFQKTNKPDQISKTVKDLCGFEEPANKINAELKEVVQRNGYRLEKLLLVRDDRFKFNLSGLLFIPDKVKGKSPAVIIVGEQGKDTVLTPDCQIIKEINRGNIVLAVDLSNTGELKYKRRIQYDNTDFWIGKLALYEGKTLMTYRAEELIMVKRFLQNKPTVDGNAISIYSNGLTGSAALHAAYFDQGFKKVIIKGAINSWEDVASTYFSKNQLANIVPNALNYYDLPDLIRWTPNTKVEIIAPVDALGNIF